MLPLGSSTTDSTSTLLHSFWERTAVKRDIKITREEEFEQCPPQRHQQTHLSNSCISSESRKLHHLPPSCRRMLGPLLYLSTLIALTGAQTITESSEIDISSCPIKFYQISYDKLYVNIHGQTVNISFGGFYNADTSQDYITLPVTTGVTLTMLPQDTAYESTIKANVPTITAGLDCSVQIGFEVDGSNVILILSRFGEQAAGNFYSQTASPVPFDIVVNTTTVESVKVSAGQKYSDISGCRVTGGALKPNTTGNFPEICNNASCSVDRIATNTICGNQGRCTGNNICVMNKTCSVIGPAIIDTLNMNSSVQSRCAYSLVNETELMISAQFQDQHRKDMALINNVTLHLTNPSTNITLAPGGQILINNSLQPTDTTELEIQGVLISKDQTGILATMTFSERYCSLFYDYAMAQIHIEVPDNAPLIGLCGDSSSFSSAKLSSESTTGCETVHNQDADGTINCTAVTQRCSILNESSFSNFNAVLDPAPYINACSATLCKYPAKDGLGCRFMWAYAQACSLINNTLEDWWPLAKCSPPKARCPDKVCRGHEFCGTTLSGNSGCLCRAIYASSYKESHTLGDPTVCMNSTASVTLVDCLLVEKDINSSLLHLNNETCKGEMDEESGTVTFSFNTINTCGAVKMEDNNNQVTYENTITLHNSSSGVIYRRPSFNMNFSCTYSQPQMETMTFRIKENWAAMTIKSGEWVYNATVKAYTDDNRMHLVDSETEVMLDQKIWCYVETEGLDGTSVCVFIDSCWATSEASSDSTPKHYLIQDGCANSADNTMTVMGNGEGTSSSFAFNIFQFTNSTSDIYIHFKLEVCVKEGNSCIPVCSNESRRRRSIPPIYVPGASALFTMAWTP